MCICVLFLRFNNKKKCGSNIPCSGEGTRFNHKVSRNEQKYTRIKASQDKRMELTYLTKSKYDI